MIAVVAGLGAALVAGPALFRVWRGPTATDRMVAAYILGVTLSIAAAAYGAAARNEAIVTSAILISLVQNVVFVAILKAARRRSFQPALAALRRAQAPQP